MSVVIAVKDKGRFVLGADKQGTLGNVKDHSATKVWEVKGYPGAIMGGVGLARANQVIQYIDGLIDRNTMASGEIDDGFIVMELTRVIYEVLERFGIKADAIEKGTGEFAAIPNSFLFAYQDRCWVIHQDLSVVEVQDYAAIGSGEEVAKGALYATPDKNPFERIVTAIDAAAEETMFVDHEVELLPTAVLRGDHEKMLKALGYTKEAIKQLKVAAFAEGDLDVDDATEPAEKSEDKKTKSSKKTSKKNV